MFKCIFIKKKIKPAKGVILDFKLLKHFFSKETMNMNLLKTLLMVEGVQNVSNFLKIIVNA